MILFMFMTMLEIRNNYDINDINVQEHTMTDLYTYVIFDTSHIF